MAQVDKDHMTELRSASDARSTAQDAEKDIQLKSVAYAINEASNIIRLFDLKSVKEFKKSKYCNPRYYSLDYIDFESMVEDGIDGIEVLINSSNVYMEMYSWDVDSLLVFNPEIVLVKERITHGLCRSVKHF